MSRRKKRRRDMKARLAIVLAGLFSLSSTPATTGAQDDLLPALSKAKHSLAEGIRQLSKGSEVAISGKFEMEEGHLSLSVYTVEKGLGTDSEHNVLKEFAGS